MIRKWAKNKVHKLFRNNGIEFIPFREIMEVNWQSCQCDNDVTIRYVLKNFQLNNVESCCVLDGKWNYNFLFRVRSCVPLFVLFSFAWDSSVANKSRKMLSTVVYSGMKVILWNRYKHFAIFATIIACMIHAFSLFECLLNILFRLRKILIILTW